MISGVSFRRLLYAQALRWSYIFFWGGATHTLHCSHRYLISVQNNQIELLEP